MRITNLDTGEIIPVVKVPFVRSPYNYDAMAVSNETGLACDDPTLTKQSFKDEADINFIVRQFGLTGQLPDNVRVPQYGDFEGVIDYHSAMNAVRQADEQFMQLPGDLRARFHNDPQNLLKFMSDDANRDEAIRLGLVNAPASVGASAAAGAASDAPAGSSTNQ